MDAGFYVRSGTQFCRWGVLSSLADPRQHTIKSWNKRQRKPMRQSKMDNPEILATLGTQDTGRGLKKTTKTQYN